MGIRKRGDAYEVNVAYKKERRFGTAKSEQEAKDLFVTLKAELINATKAPPTPDLPVLPHVQTDTTWKLSEAIKKAFEVRWSGTKSEAFYKAKCDALAAYFDADTKLSAITTDKVDALKLTLKGKSQSTINHHLVTLSMLFKIAHERGGAPMRPVLGIKQSTRGRIRWMTEQEEKIVLALLTQWGKQDMHDWTVVLIDTGFRPSESKRLTGLHIDHKNNMAHVWESKTQSGVRGVPMTKRVKAIMERRCLDHRDGPLFPYEWSVYDNVWGRIREAMKLTTDQDFVPYCLRHTFATRLIQRGVRVEVISKLMGHANVNQTMAYAKLGAEQFIAAMKTLEPSDV